ncbi:peptidoglycan DD-metalloendopeptidase family protein [Pseudoramibacter alactolyticus]
MAIGLGLWGWMAPVQAATQEQLDNVQAQMQKTDAQLAEANRQIKQLEADRVKQMDLLRSRARAMYMMGNDGYLEIFFSSDDIPGMLSRIGEVKNIMRADRDAVRRLEANRKAQEAAKGKLEAIKKAQEAQYKKLAGEFNAESAAGNSMHLSFGSGTWKNDYMWPVATNQRNALYISSGFGRRSFPGGVGSTDHKGVDVSVPTGTPMLAAADGLVVFAGEASGYGNYVAIDHGTDAKTHDTYGTGYGHLSQIKVTRGQQVKKGDVIALSGSTGHSTGPHLHLDWFLNGKQVDARTYFPALDFQGKGRGN